MAEWSKASDSSSDGAIRVGSNPTAVNLSYGRKEHNFRIGIRTLYLIDTVAEWLRRRPAKPMCSARVGSNPIGVECFLFVEGGQSCNLCTFVVVDIMPP